MRLKHFALALAACGALAIMPSTTRADSLNLVLNPTSYIGQSGGSVTLMGTFTNGVGAISFSGVAFILGSGLSAAAVQPIDYFNDVMASSQVLSNVAVFVINIDPGVPNGTVFGVGGNALTISYLSDTTGQESQVDVNFEIVIRNDQPPPGIPEPATMVLLGSGLAGLAALKRRKRGR